MSILPKSGGLRWLTQAAAAVQDSLQKVSVPIGGAGMKAAFRSKVTLPAQPAGASPLSYVPQQVRDMLDGLAHGDRPGGRAATPPPPPSGSDRFLANTFTGPAGSRPYKLYVPTGYNGQPVPLVVMLHGCTQSPDDFAAGTQMNVLADAQTVLVAYPGQVAAAHNQKCWNWYNADDQERAKGEPSIIAGITRQVAQDYAVDPRRIYVAGLSAGGAAAAIMGVTYPDLYAAIGVHSGLACGAATTLPAALAAMRQGAGGRTNLGPGGRDVPAIVFHGDRDKTVHPRNADLVAAQHLPAGGLQTRVEDGQVPGGHTYRRTLHERPDGQVVLEQWMVHGAGHAWSGGNPAGSYTDPQGPDASREMLRFFLAHTLGNPAPQ